MDDYLLTYSLPRVNLSLGATPLFVTRDFKSGIDWRFDDRSELEYHLLDDLEEIAVDLLGVPTGYSKWHWGPKKLIIKGLRRGWFDDWKAGVHGWPLKMIAHEINGDEAKAIASARNWLGIGALPPPDAATLKAREKKRRQAAAAEAAVQRFKITQAQALWAHSTPINHTAAERYLVWIRKVPIRNQWPEAVRCDPFGNLIVALTTDDGTITAVQRVLLTNDGERQIYCDDDGVWKKKKKFTTGIMAGAYVRLPGWSNDELVIAEGPEDALSIWAAGLETFAPCRVITNLYPPPGRRIVIARNDDPQPSPVDASYLKGKVRWAKRGIDFREAFPWPERRSDKTDFNDLLKAGGVAAVRKALRSPAPAAIPLRLTADETRDEALVRANQDFFKELRMHRAIRVTLGTGKSSINRDEIASFVRSMRADGDKRSVVIAVPTNHLADEAAVDFPDDIRRATWRGRGANNPLRPGETMCMNLKAVIKVQKALGDVSTNCCRRPARDGVPEMKCEFYDSKRRSANGRMFGIPRTTRYFLQNRRPWERWPRL